MSEYESEASFSFISTPSNNSVMTMTAVGEYAHISDSSGASEGGKMPGGDQSGRDGKASRTGGGNGNGGGGGGEMSDMEKMIMQRDSELNGILKSGAPAIRT